MVKKRTRKNSRTKKGGNLVEGITSFANSVVNGATNLTTTIMDKAEKFKDKHTSVPPLPQPPLATTPPQPQSTPRVLQQKPQDFPKTDPTTLLQLPPSVGGKRKYRRSRNKRKTRKSKINLRRRRKTKRRQCKCSCKKC